MKRPSASSVRFAAALSCALLGAFAAGAHAGAARPCDDPAVFQGAAVNSFVLPYRYVGSRNDEFARRASRQIAALAHLEILYSLLKYGEVGGTDLLARPGAVCDVDKVIDEVSLGRGPGVMKPGQTLVVVWGRLYDEGDELYVQSYVRFLRQGAKGPLRETIAVAYPGAGFTAPLAAALPVQSITFPPRRISKSDLTAINHEFGKAMAVRPTPSLDAPGTSIDFDADRQFPYYVTKTQGDWMWIQPINSGPAGWIRARTGASASQWSLRRWLPELVYVDAIAGFMRLRARDGAGISPARGAQIREWVDAGFAQFEQAVPAGAAAGPAGLARAVRGFIGWQLQPNAEGRAAAARLFAEARALMPDYASARNLAAVTRPFVPEADETPPTAPAIDAAAVGRMHRQIVGALSLDPHDAFALGNLDALYAAMTSKPSLGAIAPADLSQRRAVLKAQRLTKEKQGAAQDVKAVQKAAARN